jgi:hypothetical protein
MDIEHNSEEDEKMNSCYDRYARLHSIVQEIDAKPLSRTADWYLEHYELLSTYDSYFFDGIDSIHPEINDLKFRKDCDDAEALKNVLMNQFRVRGWFSLYDYQRLNKLMIAIVDSATAEPDMEVDIDFGKLVI